MSVCNTSFPSIQCWKWDNYSKLHVSIVWVGEVLNGLEMFTTIQPQQEFFAMTKQQQIFLCFWVCHKNIWRVNKFINTFNGLAGERAASYMIMIWVSKTEGSKKVILIPNTKWKCLQQARSTTGSDNKFGQPCWTRFLIKSTLSSKHMNGPTIVLAHCFHLL